MGGGGIDSRNQGRAWDLIVEGWRGVPHSYALVNQFQLLALMVRPGLALCHRDLPYYGAHWKPVSGLLPAAWEAALQGLPAPADGQRARALYRIAFPYDLTPGPADRTLVFGTSELQSVTGAMLAGTGSLKRQMAAADTVIVTPSNWSKDGFVRSGAPAERVAVVPHGVAPELFHPIDEPARAALRQKLGWDPFFVFLSVGTMTANKGLRLMLKALAAMARSFPQVRLVLKGSDGLYHSQRLVTEMADTLTQREKQIVLDRIFYLGEAFSAQTLAHLYQAADVYLSPYLAEGFNLPALEAAACGLPVICTRGGPTDDFAHPRYFLGIDSRIATRRVSQAETTRFLVPDLDHLIALMGRAVDAGNWRREARTSLPGWTAARFSWAAAIETLSAVLFAPV